MAEVLHVREETMRCVVVGKRDGITSGITSITLAESPRDAGLIVAQLLSEGVKEVSIKITTD